MSRNFERNKNSETACMFIIAVSLNCLVHVTYCHHLASVSKSSTVCFYILIFSETTGPIGTKLGRNSLDDPLKINGFFFADKKYTKETKSSKVSKGCGVFVIFFSETTR